MESLKDRILAFLRREGESARQELARLRALPVDDRVLEGDCIAGLRFEGVEPDGTLRFACPENLSRFREGDPVLLSDGERFEQGWEMAFARHDPARGKLHLEPDRFQRDRQQAERILGVLSPPAGRAGRRWCVDRRHLHLSRDLERAVETAFQDPSSGPPRALAGSLAPAFDPARRARALERAARLDLDETQREAFADAVSAETFCLVQGPPGTGKTRVLAEAARALAHSWRCGIALTAYTHRAVDNVLLALRALDPSVACLKVGDRRSTSELRAAGVELCPDPRRLRPPPGRGFVVGGTAFALSRLPPQLRFHFTFFDEAGQMPLPHALPGMLLSRRWVLAGDHHQLPPVVQGAHRDLEVTRSLFAHLHAFHSARMLTTSYRMNAAICRFVGDAFYGGRLRPAAAVADRRLPVRPEGRHAGLLDPRRPLVVGVLDHRGRRMRSPEEAEVAAGLVEELVVRHGLLMREVAVVSPFRAQNALIAGLLPRQARRTVVDTVDRIQGQEREVVIVSLAASDPDYLAQRAEFLYSANRINVAISRARSKCIVLGSRGVFRGRSLEVDHLRAMSLFSRIYREWDRVELAVPPPGARTGVQSRKTAAAR